MHNKDPITVVGVLSSIMLVAGGAMLYLNPAPTPAPIQEKTALISPFKAPPPAPPEASAPEPTKPPAPEIPAPAPEVSATISALSAPELTAEDLAKLTPAERSRYDTLRKTLQQRLQALQTLEQENTHLQQTIKHGDEENQILDAKINKLRTAPVKPADDTPPPPASTTPAPTTAK